MRSIHLFVAVIALSSALCVAAQPGPAPAAGQGTTHVAVVKTFQVFKSIQEYKAWNIKIEAMGRDLQTDLDKKKADIAATESLLAQTNQNHPSYADLLDKRDKQQSEYQIAAQTSKLKLDREQKKMVVAIYNKIEAAVAQAAQQNGIDIVISDNRQELPPLERVPLDELSRVLGTRPVMYANKNADITDLVMTMLDAEFAKNNGGAAPGPGPVPPPGPAGNNK